ncbi:hypothetical protein [Emcibacter sp. SYSU 3D8]|uniref:hypothetical protein n=1 Tax=Emcibacter sp. SYSU 3D8 TaxID=3133969 RepID=UPI0031FE9E72
MVDRDIHQCVQRQAHDAALPAFYTLCGYLVPRHNVELTAVGVTCRQCLRRAGEQPN